MIELTVSQIKYAIKHYQEIAKKEHLTKQKLRESRQQGFAYEEALEYEGFFIIPDLNNQVAFDFGDTNSGGEVLNGVNPMDNVKDFANDLLESLQELLKRKQEELAEAKRLNKVDVSEIADEFSRLDQLDADFYGALSETDQDLLVQAKDSIFYILQHHGYILNDDATAAIKPEKQKEATL